MAINRRIKIGLPFSLLEYCFPQGLLIFLIDIVLLLFSRTRCCEYWKHHYVSDVWRSPEEQDLLYFRSGKIFINSESLNLSVVYSFLESIQIYGIRKEIANLLIRNIA